MKEGHTPLKKSARSRVPSQTEMDETDLPHHEVRSSGSSTRLAKGGAGSRIHPASVRVRVEVRIRIRIRIRVRVSELFAAPCIFVLVFPCVSWRLEGVGHELPSALRHAVCRGVAERRTEWSLPVFSLKHVRNSFDASVVLNVRSIPG